MATFAFHYRYTALYSVKNCDHKYMCWESYQEYIHSLLRLFGSHYNHVCRNAPVLTQIAKFMGKTWGPPGSCRPQMGPMLAPWTLLSGELLPNDRSPTVSGAAVVAIAIVIIIIKITKKTQTDVCECCALNQSIHSDSLRVAKCF